MGLYTLEQPWVDPACQQTVVETRLYQLWIPLFVWYEDDCPLVQPFV